MAEEEKIQVQVPDKKRYFYWERRDVYRVLLSVATSFIGALLALMVFAAFHKPPVMPGKFPPPPPIQRIDVDIHRIDNYIKPPMGEFHKDPRGDFHRRGEMMPPRHMRDNKAPTPEKNVKK